MRVKAIKTKKITYGDDLLEILNAYLPKKLPDKSVVVISSKIVSITEGRIIKKTHDSLRDELAKKESELYMMRKINKFNYMITVTRGVLMGSGGIDESNGNGYLILWPKDAQKSANKIREFLTEKYKVSNIGVIIADSKSTPLRWGATGFALSYSGFKALKNYVGKPDIFGRIMQSEHANIYDALATSAVLTMGEGNEQKPIAIINNIEFVEFQKRNPTKEELDILRLDIESDFFAPVLTSSKWQKVRKT